MEENDSKSFRIRFDDDDSIQPVRREEASSSLPLKKLSQRMTLISILIPCAIALVIMFVYSNLNKKVSGIQNSGADTVQSLSKNLEEKLKALAAKTDQLDVLIKTQSDQLEKKISSVSADLGKNKNAFDKSVTAKASQNDLNRHIKEITGKINGLEKNISRLSSDIQAIDSGLRGRMEKEIKGISDTAAVMTDDLHNLKQEISRLSEAGIDRSKLDYELNLQEKRYKTALREAKADLEKKIASFRKESETRKPAGEVSVKKAEDSIKKPLPKKDTSLKPEANGPKGDEFIEQDISE